MTDGDETPPEATGEVGQVPPRPATASTVRFALLIVTVLATSSFVFLSMYLLVPGKADLVRQTTDTCQAALEADPAWSAGSTSQAEADRRHAAAGRWRDCLRPVFVELLVVVGSGVGVLVVVAGVAYLAHPYWIIRRRRLRPLAGVAPPALTEYLDGLADRMGLARPPGWLLAPGRGTTGGQVFGLPGRRFVQLDAGLVVRYLTDRPAFRAVALHELAHLRNRDVDRTYLTVSVWRAFIAVVVVPFLVLRLHPRLLSTPLRWEPPTFVPPGAGTFNLVAIAGLTVLGYLTRNAVLRVREFEADAVAHAVDAPHGALSTVLQRLPAPAAAGPPTGGRGLPLLAAGLRWGRARLGTHPQPRRRLAAISDPRSAAAGATGGLWELTGIGVAAGAAAVNLVMVAFFANLWPMLGLAVVAVVVGPPMMLVLTAVCWRAGAGDHRRRPALVWLSGPIVLVAGFVAGTLLAASGLGRGAQPAGSWLVAATVFVGAVVPVAAWVVSAVRGVLADPLTASRQRRSLIAVSVAATLAGVTILTVWLPFALQPYGFAVVWGQAPAGAGGTIGWYERLAVVSGAALGSLRMLVLHPLVLPALAALALVPVLIWPRRRMRLRRVVVPTLAGAALAVVGSVTVPLALRAALPAAVRRDPPENVPGAPFYVVLDNTTIVVGSLAVALAVAVVTARRGPGRPALAALAAILTALVAVAAMALGAVPVQCETNVWEIQPPPTNCLPAQRPATLASYLLWTLLQGLVLAVPLAALAGGAGALARRGARRQPGTPHASSTVDGPAVDGPAGDGPSTVPRWRRAMTAALLVALVAVLAWLTWAILPEARDAWLTPQFR